MNKRSVIILLALLGFSSITNAQKFRYQSVVYEVVSVPRHEVEVNYVPEDATSVVIPPEVNFNGETFKVIGIGDGGRERSGGHWLTGYYNDGEGYYSFSECKLLKSVVLPNTIRYIGEFAFHHCTWLRSINMPSSLEKIGYAAFKGCESIESITLPNKLKTIETNAFYGCKSLKKVKLPKSSIHLDDRVFEGCNASMIFIFPPEFGFSWDNYFVLKPEYEYLKGKLDDNFQGKQELITLYQFMEDALEYPDKYLRDSYGKPMASLVKRALINAGKYEEVLSVYPNDSEVLELKKEYEINRAIRMGDAYMSYHNYTEAKQNYTQALQLSPNDSTIITKLASVNEVIAEKERLRLEAEKKARREAEEQQVQMVVEDLIKQAFEYKRIGQLEMSAIKLQQALDTTAMHNYNYKASEMSQLLDTIRDIQTSITDTSKFYDYKMLRPDLYNSFDSILSSRIKAFMYNRGKNMRRNHISVTFYSDNTPISFQIEKPSRELKNLCKNSLFIYKPQPLKIDGHSLKANAAFDYDFEYAKGKVKVHKKNNYVPTIDIRYKVSPQLEAGIKNRIVSSLDNLNYECWGDYILYVTSADVNGHMNHNIEFKRGRFINGPQNAWKSLILPGWGDKYVDSNKKFDWWKTVISYGATATGTGIVVYNKNLEGYRNTYYDIVGYGLIAIGVGQWLYDIIHVGVQGAKNKKEAKSRMGMYLSYDASHNAPEMGYSFSF